MTEQVELKIPYNEVTRIAIQCACGTETIIDISKETNKDFRTKWETKAFMGVEYEKADDYWRDRES